MADFADEDDFGDFVMVAPAQSAPVQVSRLDSFDFGGPVKAADTLVASVAEPTPVRNRAPLSPSPVSEMMMSMHGLKPEKVATGEMVGPKNPPPSGASLDPFSLDFAFSEPSNNTHSSKTTSETVPSKESPSASLSGAIGNDWGDFTAVKAQAAAAEVSTANADVSTPGGGVISPNADISTRNAGVVRANADVVIPDADISSEVLKAPPKPPLLSSIHPPLSWTTGVRTSPRHPDAKPGLSARITRSPRSSPHGSPRSSPQRSSPRARRSSLEPATSSPRSSTLSRPPSKTEPSKIETSKLDPVGFKTKPAAKQKGGAVLIGNLMPLNGQRERRSSNQDLNQARFAMAAGLASDWASDFARPEGVPGTNEAAPAVTAPVQVADLMDWGDNEAAGLEAPAAQTDPPDVDDFGDGFGDFVSATSSTSTSRRTSDFDFFSSEPIGQPNGLSTGLDNPSGFGSEAGSGNALQGLFAAGGTSTAKDINGLGSSHVAGGQSATGGSGNPSGAVKQTSGPLDDFLGESFPTVKEQQNGLERSSGGTTGHNGGGFPAAFAPPLVVDFKSGLEGVKQGVDNLTPQSTLHSTAPSLFPDPEPFGDGLATLTGFEDPFGGLPVRNFGASSGSKFEAVSGPTTGVNSRTASDKPSAVVSKEATVLPFKQPSVFAFEQPSVSASEHVSISAARQAFDGSGKGSDAPIGMKGSGRLSRSMFGEESDEETEPTGPGPIPGVSTGAAKAAPSVRSLEALLSSSGYQTSIGKAWGPSENGASTGRSDGEKSSQKNDVNAANPAAEIAHGNGVELRGEMETGIALESLGSFSFGPPGTRLSNSAPLGGVQNAAVSTPQEDDDEFGDFAAAEMSSGAVDVNGFSGGGTSGVSTSGSNPLDDSLFGGFEVPSGKSETGLDNGFGVPGGATGSESRFGEGSGLAGRSERANSAVPDLFGGSDVSPTSAPAFPQVDPFGVSGEPFPGDSQRKKAPVGDGKAAGIIENGLPESAASNGKKVGPSVLDDSFMGGGETSKAAFEDDDEFGDFVDSRRSSATEASTSAIDPFGVNGEPSRVIGESRRVSCGSGRVGDNSRRVSDVVPLTPGDDFFTGGFHDSARTSVSGDPFEGLEGLAGSGVGLPSGIQGLKGSGESKTGDGLEEWAGLSNGGVLSSNESSGAQAFGGFDGLANSSAGQVSNGFQAAGLGFDFLSGAASSDNANQVKAKPGKANEVQDPFLDLMGMDVSVPSTSDSLQGLDFSSLETQGSVGVSNRQGLPGFDGTQSLNGVSEPRRSLSERRQRRERSRRSSSASEGESVQNRGSHSRAASWQSGGNRTLERTGSGKRTSYKENDLLEVGMQLLEDGQLPEARACWAHIEAQRKLPEKKSQYEKAMVSSPMKAFDLMKEIHDLEASLAPAHKIATWQKPPGIGSRRSSSNASENGRSGGRIDSDPPTEVQRAFVRAWEDLAHACADELEEGQEIWQRARDAKCDQELLRSAKGRQYFASLCRIYLLSALLSALSQWRKPWLAAASGEGLSSCLADCRLVAEGDLGRALRVASQRSKVLGFTDVWPAARGAVLEAAVGTPSRQAVGKGPERPACALTLVPEGALRGVPLVTWRGQTFLAPVANLWRNRISEALPDGL